MLLTLTVSRFPTLPTLSSQMAWFMLKLFLTSVLLHSNFQTNILTEFLLVVRNCWNTLNLPI
jgi:hypothetical protein